MAVDIRITNTNRNNPNLPKRTLLKSLRGYVGVKGPKYRDPKTATPVISAYLLNRCPTHLFC